MPHHLGAAFEAGKLTETETLFINSAAGYARDLIGAVPMAGTEKLAPRDAPQDGSRNGG